LGFTEGTTNSVGAFAVTDPIVLDDPVLAAEMAACVTVGETNGEEAIGGATNCDIPSYCGMENWMFDPVSFAAAGDFRSLLEGAGEAVLAGADIEFGSMEANCLFHGFLSVGGGESLV
jgi:hypothetical protein